MLCAAGLTRLHVLQTDLREIPELQPEMCQSYLFYIPISETKNDPQCPFTPWDKEALLLIGQFVSSSTLGIPDAAQLAGLAGVVRS